MLALWINPPVGREFHGRANLEQQSLEKGTTTRLKVDILPNGLQIKPAFTPADINPQFDRDPGMEYNSDAKGPGSKLLS